MKRLTAKELDVFVQKANRELDAERKAGRLKPFTGKLKRNRTGADRHGAKSQPVTSH